MTMKLKDLLSARRHFHECRKALDAEIFIYRLRIEDNSKALENARAVGNIEDENKYSSVIGRYENLIKQTETRKEELLKTSGGDPKQAKAAWAEYAERYNTEFRQKQKAFIKARKELYRLFNELVSMQNDALLLRIQCGEICGIVPRDSVDQDKHYSSLKKLQTIDSSNNMGGCPEIVYFSAYNPPDQKRRQMYRDIIFSHKPNYPEED